MWFSGEKVKGQGHGEIKCTLPMEASRLTVHRQEIIELINLIDWSVGATQAGARKTSVNDM